MRLIRLRTLLPLILLEENEPYVLVHPRFGRPPIVAFTGTTKVIDLVDNLRASGTQWPPQSESHGIVHNGFAKRTLRLLQNDDMKDFIKRFDNFVIAGYSLGAGVSVLLASKLKAEEKHVRFVYTYGSPTIGDAEFCDLYRKQGLWEKTLRYATPRDPISNNIPVYNHVGEKILVPFEGEKRWQHHDLFTYQKHAKDSDALASEIVCLDF